MEYRRERMRLELEQITAALSRLTGLASRWNGHVELVPNADFKGKKRFRCDIQVDAALANRPERWSTLIHEALHGLSAGYGPGDYQELPGWEEGVVEQLQRLLRPAVLAALGVREEQATFQRDEAIHAYNGYITALERLRAHLLMPYVENFYTDLLGTPLRERPASVLSLSQGMEKARRLAFLRTFSAANAELKGFMRF